MQTKVCKDYAALSEYAADWLLNGIRQKPSFVVCLASGDTPRLALSLFAQRIIHEKVDISAVQFIGLDEWLGIPPDNIGSCHYFFQSVLFRPLNVQPVQIHLFDGLSPDPDVACKTMDHFIREKGGIDRMLVGVGMNGHIGFNEPGVPFDCYSHVVDLDASTTSVGQKYFSQPTILAKGITLGLRHLMEAKQVMLIANGEKKAGIVQALRNEPIGNKLPATIIRSHPNSFLVLDEAADTLK